MKSSLLLACLIARAEPIPKGWEGLKFKMIRVAR